MKGPRTISGYRSIWASALGGLAGAAVAILWSAAPARAESAYCADLRAQIAQAGTDGRGARFRAAAGKQRAEYAQLAARGRALGCDRGQFFFLGDPPPAQCGPLNARLNQLAGSIDSYERAAADEGGQRQALAARYDAQCRNPQVVAARAPRARNFFEELFGLAPPDETSGLRDIPVGPDSESLDEELYDERPRGGPMAICVRSCDGGFFPISYSARQDNLDELETQCRALCPNAETKLYTQSQRKGLDSALSIDGEAYSDHPNAFKFQKTYDPACGCKPPGQSWAEALAEAERLIAERHAKDQVVTAEQAEQLSRPTPPGARSARGRVDAMTSPPPLLAPETGAAAPEVYREIMGPDGIKRRVRVVAPTL